MASSLEKLKVEELDDLAAQLGLADYPVDGLKADKVAALAAAGAGSDSEEEVVYRLRLKKDGTEAASFMAGTQAVELTDADPLFETTDRNIWAALKDQPFLEEVD